MAGFTIKKIQISPVRKTSTSVYALAIVAPLSHVGSISFEIGQTQGIRWGADEENINQTNILWQFWHKRWQAFSHTTKDNGWGPSLFKLQLNRMADTYFPSQMQGNYSTIQRLLNIWSARPGSCSHGTSNKTQTTKRRLVYVVVITRDVRGAKSLLLYRHQFHVLIFITIKSLEFTTLLSHYVAALQKSVCSKKNFR